MFISGWSFNYNPQYPKIIQFSSTWRHPVKPSNCIASFTWLPTSFFGDVCKFCYELQICKIFCLLENVVSLQPRGKHGLFNSWLGQQNINVITIFKYYRIFVRQMKVQPFNNRWSLVNLEWKYSPTRFTRRNIPTIKIMLNLINSMFSCFIFILDRHKSHGNVIITFINVLE